MELETALNFARDHRQSVLVTARSDGRPQLSNIVHSVGADGLVRISITDTRAKTRNARRDPRVSLYITREDFYAYAVIDGTAELSDVTTEPGDAAGLQLQSLYRELAGEHEDWDDYFEAMVRDQRLVLTIRPERAYGMIQ